MSYLLFRTNLYTSKGRALGLLRNVISLKSIEWCILIFRTKPFTVVTRCHHPSLRETVIAATKVQIIRTFLICYWSMFYCELWYPQNHSIYYSSYRFHRRIYYGMIFMKICKIGAGWDILSFLVIRHRMVKMLIASSWPSMGRNWMPSTVLILDPLSTGLFSSLLMQLEEALKNEFLSKSAWSWRA